MNCVNIPKNLKFSFWLRVDGRLHFDSLLENSGVSAMEHIDCNIEFKYVFLGERQA